MPLGRPPIGVAFGAIRHRGTGWSVTWRVTNAGADAVTVVEAWHPHRRFHCSRLRRTLRVPPRGAASLELPARIDARPGDPIENCFVILRVTRGRERWRVLARFTLRVDEAGTPRPLIAQVDVHPS